MRVVTHRSIQELDLAPSTLQFLQNNHLVDVVSREAIRFGANCAGTITGGDTMGCGIAANDTYAVISVGAGARVGISNHSFRGDPNQANLPKYLIEVANDATLVDWNGNPIEPGCTRTGISNRVANLRTGSATPLT